MLKCQSQNTYIQKATVGYKTVVSTTVYKETKAIEENMKIRYLVSHVSFAKSEKLGLVPFTCVTFKTCHFVKVIIFTPCDCVIISDGIIDYFLSYL